MSLFQPYTYKCIENICELKFVPKVGFYLENNSQAKGFFVKYKNGDYTEENTNIPNPIEFSEISLNYTTDTLNGMYNGFKFSNSDTALDFSLYPLSDHLALGIWYNDTKIGDIDLFLLTNDNFTNIFFPEPNIIVNY